MSHNIGSIGIFDAVSLRGAHGGTDRERIEAQSEAALAQLPRFRQRLSGCRCMVTRCGSTTSDVAVAG